MSVVINGTYSNEVAATNIAAAQLEGLCLQYNASAVLIPATTVIDAVLLSEVVTATEYTNRMFIYHDIDFGAYTQIGELSSVAKDVQKKSALGLLVTAGGGIAAGVELELAAGVLQAFSAGTKVARAIDAIPSGATRTGLIHFY